MGDENIGGVVRRQWEMDTEPVATSVSTSKHRHRPVSYIRIQMQSPLAKFKATFFLPFLLKEVK